MPHPRRQANAHTGWRASLAGLDVVVLLRANVNRPDSRALRAEIDLLWDKLLAKREQA